MASIPLAINNAPPPTGALSLQALINQTRLQQQAEQQNQQTLQQQTQLAPLQVQQQQSQTQESQIQAQQAQQQQQDIQRFNKAFLDSGGDWNQTMANAPAAGVSAMFMQQAQMNRMKLLQTMQGYSEGQAKILNDQSDAMGKAALVVKDAAPEDRATVAAQQLNTLKTSGLFQPGQLPETVPTDDKSLNTYIAHSAATQDLLKEAIANKASQAAQPGIQAAEADKQQQSVAQLLANTQGDASYQSVLRNAKVQGIPDSILGEFPPNWSPQAVKLAAQMSLSPEARAKLPVENLELASYLQQNPGRTPADFAAFKATLPAEAQLRVLQTLMGKNPPAAAGTPGGAGGPALTAAQQMGNKVGFTPQALDQAAQMYLTTGQLPQGARGGVAGLAQNRAIMNRAAEIDPNSNILANKGTYNANAKSLDNVQKNYDQVTAFENTALKNLDQVVAAGQQVPDLGARFANIPVRMISNSMLGTPQMARFRTALLTAQNEAAKVLTSANATGVLSDSARHEAQEVLDGNLPFPAMMASINQLKTDFGNREQAYREQIGNIQGRLSAKPGTSGTSSASAPAATSAPTKILSMAAVQKAAKDHNVSIDEATRQAKAAGYTIQ